MELLVWGAGAIGGTIGAFLTRAGHQISFVDKASDHVRAIREKGLSIAGPIAEFTVTAPVFTPDVVEGCWETILLCVKAHDTASAVRDLAPYLNSTGCVVSVQNGLNELLIGETVGSRRTVGSFVNFGADYMEPGLVLYGGRGAVVLGEIDGRITDRIQSLHRTFLDFDPDAVVTTNIWGYLWSKLAYGTQLFVSALTNESIAAALAHPGYRRLFIAVAREVLAVAGSQGIETEAFNGFDPQAFSPQVEEAVSLGSLDEMVAFNSRSAKSHSGIWRDLVVRKRKSEAEALLGPVVRAGAESGVPTPLTAKTMSLIAEIETGARPIQLSNLDILNELL